MNKEIIGYGSFFHKTEADEIENYKTDFLNDHYGLFYTGRHAIRHVVDSIQKLRGKHTLWLPKYYCQHVTHWINQVYDDVHYYDIDPFNVDAGSAVDWGLFNKDKDIVLLNNFWGLFEYDLSAKEELPIIIEDHSHGWMSSGCLHSQADVCISSLRKTLPVPLGGIAWAPHGSRVKIDFEVMEPQNSDKVHQFIEASWMPMERAMQLKEQCKLENNKQQYLSLFGDAEAFLHEQYEVMPIAKPHETVLKTFLKKDYNLYKDKNFKTLFPVLNNVGAFKILNKEGDVSFGLDLVFANREDFNNLKSYLIQHKIYPSELWPGNSIEQEYKYLLNIHIDFRYNTSDMDYLAQTLINFSKAQSL